MNKFIQSSSDEDDEEDQERSKEVGSKKDTHKHTTEKIQNVVQNDVDSLPARRLYKGVDFNNPTDYSKVIDKLYV
jgi:hypothetical protein